MQRIKMDPLWESVHLDYDSFYALNVNKQFFKNRINYLLKETVLKFCKNKNSKILDIGCGAGIDSVCLAKCGYEVTGIDINEGLLEKAKELLKKSEKIFEKKLSVKFKKQNIFDMPKIIEKFDAILNVCLIQYWDKKDRLIALKNMKNSLKREGFLVVVNTNTSNPLFKAIPMTEISTGNIDYNHKMLKRELKSTGFKIRSVGHIGLSSHFEQYLKFKPVKYILIVANKFFGILPNKLKSYFAPHSFIVAQII